MGIEDRVAIKLGDETTRICESYEVHMGVLTQPSRFAIRIGHSGTIAELFAKYPPGTPFELSVFDGKKYLPQFKGTIDARSAGGFAATATFRGRDVLGGLINHHATADKSYAGLTYFDFAWKVMTDAGLKFDTIFDESDDDRKKRTGARAAKGSEKVKNDIKRKGKKRMVHPPTIKAGDEYFSFLKQHLSAAGLFLFSGAHGEIILGSPDREQSPLYQIHNRRDGDANQAGTVVDFQVDDDVSERFSESTVYAVGGNARIGRSQAHSTVEDDYLVTLGIRRAFCKVDRRLSSVDEAEFYARRAITEAKRSGFQVQYTLAGHTTVPLIPVADGAGRICWTRDSIVQVLDEECGFKEEMFIEGVTLLGTAERTETVVKCMRKADLTYLDDPGDTFAAEHERVNQRGSQGS